MKRNTTFNLPEELMQRAKAYAAAHDTTVATIVREHLEKVTGFTPAGGEDDPLGEFSAGRMSKERAIERLGLRDYAGLLLALGERGLALPQLPPHTIQEMTATLRRVLRDRPPR